MNRRKYVLTVDDDPEFNKLMQHRFTRLGCDIVTTTSTDEFAEKIKLKVPDLCLIDLNIEKEGMGFSIITAIRDKLKYGCPIIVMSGESRQAIVAHALEIGADDYIVKPPLRETFEAVINKYLKKETDWISNIVSDTTAVPADQRPCHMEFSCEITELSEYSVKFLSGNLVKKGTRVTLRGPAWDEINPEKKEAIVSVIGSSVSSEEGYIIDGEFDDTDKQLMSNVRNWLASRK